ncbi:MAG: hypothetical protein WAW06_11695 [bacterium]
MATKLAFRTKLGAVGVAPGQSKLLGTVDVSPYSQIRVVADERTGSLTNVAIRLTITEKTELVAQLDILHLTPHSELTRVYDVPGTKLSIYAEAAPLFLAGSGKIACKPASSGKESDAVEVLVYGN